MLERDSTFDGCLQAGCSRPRTRFSAFCEEHHQRQLAGLESQGALRADEWEQVFKGRRWLQALRLAAGAIAGIYVHDRWRMTAICLAAAIIVTLIGWERGARVFMRNDGKMALPVVYSPSVLFTIPLFVYSCVVILLGVIVVRLPHFYQPNGVSPSLLSLVRAETLAAMYVVPIYPTWRFKSVRIALAVLITVAEGVAYAVAPLGRTGAITAALILPLFCAICLAIGRASNLASFDLAS